MGEITILMAILILCLIALPFICLGILYQLAKSGNQLTYIKQNHIMYIVKGETVSEEIVNVPGYKKSQKPDSQGRYWIVPRDSLEEDIPGGTIEAFIRKQFGIVYVSFLYPLKKVWEFNVSVKKLKGNHPSTIGEGEGWIDDRGEKRVSGLRFEVVRPIIVHNVTLPGDGSQINVVIQAQFITVCPYVPTFIFEGKHYPLLDEMIRAEFIEFCSTYKVSDDNGNKEPLSYNTWLSLKKGQGSDFYCEMISMNCSQRFLNSLDNEKKVHLEKNVFQSGSKPTNKDGKGYIEVFGLAMTNISLNSWEAAGMAQIAEAKRQVERNKLLAEAAIEEAKGSAEAIKMNREGEAIGISFLVNKVRKENPHLSEAEIWKGVARMLEKEKLPRGITTYVEGSQEGEEKNKPNILL